MDEDEAQASIVHSSPLRLYPSLEPLRISSLDSSGEQKDHNGDETQHVQPNRVHFVIFRDSLK
jgi:hypothetical protein